MGSYRRAVTRHRSGQPPIERNAHFTGAAGRVAIGGQLLATDPDSPQFEEMLTLPGRPAGFL